MFELNGKTYTIEQLQKAAAKYGYSFNEYLSKMKDKGLVEISTPSVAQQAVTEKDDEQAVKTSTTATDAGVGEEKASDTAFKSEDTLLESQNKKSDKEKELEQMAIKALPTTIETGVYASRFKDNIPPQVMSAFYSAQSGGLEWLKKTAGGQAADWLTFNIPNTSIAFIDPETNEEITFAQNPEKFKELNSRNQGQENIITKYVGTDDEIGDIADNKIKSLINDYVEEKKKIKYMGEGVVAGVRGVLGQEGYEDAGFADIVGGTFNFVSSMLATLGPAALTRGVSLAPQIGGPMFADYNLEKAKTLYGDNPDSFEKLQENNQVDFTTPAILTTAATAMEYIGFKGISNYITKASFSNRGLVGLLMTQSKEGITEFLQLGTETINIELAKGKSKLDAVDKALNVMGSDTGLEAFLGGFIASGVIGGAGKTITRALRNTSEGKRVVKNSLQELSNLQTQKSNSNSKQVKDALDFEIQKVEEQLKNYLQNNENISKELNNSQKKQLETLIKRKDILNANKNNLLDQKEKGIITNKEAGYAIRSINNENNAISNQIQDIKESINIKDLEQDIAFAEQGAEKLGIDIKILDTAKNSEDQKIINEVFTDEEGKKVSGVEGVYSPKYNKIYIDKVEAAKKEKVTTGSHELLHGILANAAKIDNKILEDFKKQLSTDQINIVNKKLTDNYDAKYIKNNPDEFITQFSDAIAAGEISYNENLFTKLGDLITPILRAVGFNKIKFETGRDVYNFMREYNKSMDQGQISRDILQAVNTKQQPADTKFSRSTPLQAINNLIPDNITTEAAYNSFIRNEKNAITIRDAINKEGGVINNIVRKNQITKEEGDKIIDDLIIRIFNFNPEATREDGTKVGNEFGEFIFSNIPFSRKEARKELAIEGQKTIQEQSIDQTDLNIDIADDIKQADDIIEVKELKSELRKIVGVERARGLDVARNILKGKLPAVTDKKIKGAINKQARDEYLTEIRDLLNSLTNDQRLKIVQTLPIQDLVKLEKLQENKIFASLIKENLSPTEVDKAFKQGKLPKTTNRLSGPSLYQRLDVTIEQINKFFNSKRRNAFAGVIAENLIKDALPEVTLETESKQRRNIAEQSQGRKIDKKDREKILNVVERDPGLKYKITKQGTEILNLAGVKDKYNDFKSTNDVDVYIKDVKKMERVFKTPDYNILNSTVLQFTKDVIEDKKIRTYLRGELKNLELKATIGRTPANKFFGNNPQSLLKSINNTERTKKYNNKHRKVFIAAVKQMKNVIDNDKNLALPLTYLIENAINERSNPFSLGAEFLGGDLNAKQTNKGFLEYDHSFPQTQAVRLIMDGILNNKGKNFQENLDRVLENYYIIALNKEDQAKINKIGEGKKLKENERWFDRLIKANIDLSKYKYAGVEYETIQDFIDNVKTTPELIKSKKQASIFNDKILPPQEKVKGIYTNNMVLNKMAEVDNENLSQELKFSRSGNLNKIFSNIIENKTGIPSDLRKSYSKVKAEVEGASKGKFDWFIPPSAEDFVGLLYKTLSKGSLGDNQMAFYKAHLLNPFARAMDNISRDRVALMNDFVALKKELKVIPKTLKKKIDYQGFNKEQAVRVYIWNKQKMEIPGLAKKDLNALTSFVKNDNDLKLFADQLISMQKGDKYVAPREGWNAGTITTDLMEGLNTVKRAKYLEVWQSNVDEMFSEINLNKLEGSFGKNYRVALENILNRMKTGKNRSFGGDTLTGRVTDWLTNSIGAIMFFNTRSAVLQTISAINFINFSDNNIFAAGKAFANQPQYWKDFKKLFNSDFLVERRDGLKLNVNEADIADMAKKGGVRGVISELLRLGFLPTQIADSFAIASGGSTFYRNRIKALEKQGLSTKEAETKAFQDFRETAEESQQSSRPDRISQQQAGPLGRVILAFANTPAQYARIIKKAASDLKNRRGDDKTNVSKILYYGIAQNLIFNALQQALFGLAFGDEEEEDKEEKRYINVC